MSDSTVTVTREELYDLVWSTPMSEIARDYRVAGADIAKACQRLNVPRPPRGYWAQMAVGRQIEKSALPIKDADTPAATTFSPICSDDDPACDTAAGVDRQNFVVPGNLRGCHPLISATRKSLEVSEPDVNHLISATGEGTVRISVSRASIHRALCIFEALIRASESLGWKVEATAGNGETLINTESDPVSVELTEKVDRSEKERPPGERYWYKTYVYTPTGNLVIRITDYLTDGMRRSWGDGRRQRIEDILPDIIAGIKRASENILEQRLKSEARHREYEEDKRLREEQGRRVKVEKERRARMEVEVLGWQKAAAIRGFCDELLRKIADSPDDFPSEGANAWIAWARALASKHDPFENGYIQDAIKHEQLDPNLDCESWNSYW